MAEFPETTWGMIANMRDPAQKEWRAGLDALCRRYWAPICSYARAAWARTDDDAGDLTQEFFLWLLSGEVLARFEPERGSFRHFLKGLLRNFSRNEAQARRRQKRGGGRAQVPVEEAEAELGREDEQLAAAEAAFDRAWERELTRRALDRLRERLLSQPRTTVRWQIYEAYDLAPGEARPTHAELSRRFELPAKEVQAHLYAARDRLREELRAELLLTVASTQDLEDEWRRIVGA